MKDKGVFQVAFENFFTRIGLPLVGFFFLCMVTSGLFEDKAISNHLGFASLLGMIFTLLFGVLVGFISMRGMNQRNK